MKRFATYNESFNDISKFSSSNGTDECTSHLERILDEAEKLIHPLSNSYTKLTEIDLASPNSPRGSAVSGNLSSYIA